MRLVTYRDNGSARPGRLDGDTVVPLAGRSVKELLAGGLDGVTGDGDPLPLASVSLLPPVPHPE